jgi:hypothetical protein
MRENIQPLAFWTWLTVSHSLSQINLILNLNSNPFHVRRNSVSVLQLTACGQVSSYFCRARDLFGDCPLYSWTLSGPGALLGAMVKWETLLLVPCISRSSSQQLISSEHVTLSGPLSDQLGLGFLRVSLYLCAFCLSLPSKSLSPSWTPGITFFKCVYVLPVPLLQESRVHSSKKE